DRRPPARGGARAAGRQRLRREVRPQARRQADRLRRAEDPRRLAGGGRPAVQRPASGRARRWRRRVAVFSDAFIRRPILATVCSLVIILAGAICIPTLPTAPYPQLAP